MRLIECNQGSEEWHLARAGVTTASDFADAVAITGGLDERQLAYVNALRGGSTEAEAMLASGYKAKPKFSGLERALAGLPVGEPADPEIRLAVKKAIERISKKPYGNTGGNFYATQRGHEGEGYARMRYESRFELIVEEAGLYVTDENLFGASVDGLVGDDGLIEVKVPLDLLKVIRIIQTGDLSEYMHQMQGQLWVTGRKWVDFLMGVPDLAELNNGNELYVKRVLRDDDFIETMEAQLWEHEGRVRKYEAMLRQPYTQAANDLMARAAA